MTLTAWSVDLIDYLWKELYLSTNCGMEATRKLDCCFWQELWDLLIEVYTQHQQSDGVRVCDVYGLQVKHDGNNENYIGNTKGF